jgi:hypothetical protein
MMVDPARHGKPLRPGCPCTSALAGTWWLTGSRPDRVRVDAVGHRAQGESGQHGGDVWCSEREPLMEQSCTGMIAMVGDDRAP